MDPRIAALFAIAAIDSMPRKSNREMLIVADPERKALRDENFNEFTRAKEPSRISAPAHNLSRECARRRKQQ